MILKLSPVELNSRSGANLNLIDVREYAEFAGGAIPGAKLVPLASLRSELEAWDRTSAYLMVCKSGKRSLQAVELMLGAGFNDVALLEGGTDAWIAAGLPIQVAEKRPWSLERQVRVTAGAMVVISAVLGLTLSHWFFAWTLFVGSGLVFAGATDTCMMGTLLGRMPWNRASPSASSCAA